jgi:hypothetical protein
VTLHEIFGPNDVIWSQDHKTEIGDQTQISSIWVAEMATKSQISSIWLAEMATGDLRCLRIATGLQSQCYDLRPRLTNWTISHSLPCIYRILSANGSSQQQRKDMCLLLPICLPVLNRPGILVTYDENECWFRGYFLPFWPAYQFVVGRNIGPYWLCQHWSQNENFFSKLFP